jgi:formylglycine-generating enzyme required for sulfatase activity
LSGVSGIIKGTLSESNPYTLPISGFTTGGTLNVAVSKTGFIISASPKSVAIYYYAVPAGFVRIEGGTFTMGSPSNEPQRNSEEVQHQVTVSAFYMGKYQVTQAEYQSVMGTNPSNFKGSNLPVETVSWYDAVEYCNRLSQREGLIPAYTIDKSRSDPNNTSNIDDIKWLVTLNQNANGYRLPTEAEWEYACRAGTTTPFSTGNNITTSQANYYGDYPYNNNATGIYRKKTTAVGSFAPNPWGLYDMHGNVWEWCWDWAGNYSSEAQDDPRGPVSGGDRVVRGGSWSHAGQALRSAARL